MSMCLAIGVMGFAVFAAATQTLVVNNTVSFVSNHVLATIDGTVTGATLATENTAGELAYNASVTNSSEGTNVFADWEIGAIDLADQDAPIIYTITITNNSLERAFTVEFAAVIAQWNFEDVTIDAPEVEHNVDRAMTQSINGAEATTWDGTEITVPAEGNVVVVITINIHDAGEEIATFDNGFTVTLNNVPA